MEIIENNIISFFVRQTNWIAKMISHDPDTKVGCIIVKNNIIISHGANTLPFGSTIKEDRLERPTKYDWIVHAEEVAITSAAKRGVSVDGSTMFLNWFPCPRCAGIIANSGIKKLICDIPRDERDSRYVNEFEISREKLIEACITIEYVDYYEHR